MAEQRPPVSVVMPFAGDRADAQRAAAALAQLKIAPGDEMLLVDNSGTAQNANGVKVVSARRRTLPGACPQRGRAHRSG